MKKIGEPSAPNFKDQRHNSNWKSATRLLQSHIDRVVSGNVYQEEVSEPRRLKAFKEERVNHLYNSKGVMTGLGQGSDATYSAGGNLAMQRSLGRKQNVVQTRKFFFESTNPANP